MMPRFRIFDTIPFSFSGETGQNSEPSLAVDPLDPTQIFAGAFSSTFVGGGVASPYFKSITGGTAWFDDGFLVTQDKSLAWKLDGSGAITTTLLNDVINTYFEATGGSSFGAPINTFNPVHQLDQPWVRTGPSNHVYVGYNDLSFFPGDTARMLVSTNGGVNYTDVALDRLGGPIIQDSPSIREAVNGNSVYAVFERWNTQIENDANGRRFTSQVVVVRSDNGGADGFTALGAGGNGVVAGTPTAVFANTSNTPLTLGQERTGSDLAIAVDPNNAAHVVTAWADAPGANGAGILQLHLAESFNSGASWTQDKFVTPAATRSDQPAVAISSTGAIGLLYNNYDPATDLLSQHIVTTTNDFVTFTDQTLATEKNSTPISQFHPYLGDFFDLTSVGNTFYGVFSASNADNGTDAQFSNVVFGRNFTGNSGTSSFHLVDTNGNPVASSIDTYFFTYQLGDAFGKIFLQSNDGQNAYWLMDQSVRVGTGANLPFTGPTWHVKALVDYDKNGPDFSDLVWQNDNGAVAIWQLQGTTPIVQSNLGVPNPGPTWHVQAAKDFDGNQVADVLFQNDNGVIALWELKDTGAGPEILKQFNIGQSPGPTWHAVAAGDFNGDARAGILFFNDNGVSAAIWEMNPTGPAIGPNGTFTQQVNLPSTGSSTWHPIAAADFNGDGKDDILWQNTNGAVAIWEMTGNGAGTTTAIKPNGQFNIDGTQSVGPTWHVVAARDFNNDSKADLLWQNDNGAIALWENFTEGPLGSVHASFTVQQNITPQPNPSGHLDWHIV